jgi:acid phosphatase (class A)
VHGVWAGVLAVMAAVIATPHAATTPASVDDLRFERWSTAALAFLARPPHFLGRDELFALSVPPPPANSSPQTRTELDELLALQAARTPAQQRAIEAHREFQNVCEVILQAGHGRLRSGPRTRALLMHVEQDASLAVFHAKQRFQRPRPHQLEPRLHPCTAVPGHPAYPSGHALQGYLIARVLALIFPEDRQALMDAGTLIGHEREIAGLHYPSDARASRALGEALFDRLQRNEAFLAEVAAARAEWHRAPGQ